MEEYRVIIRPVFGSRNQKPNLIGTSRFFSASNIGCKESKLYWSANQDICASLPRSCSKFELNIKKNYILDGGFSVEVYDKQAPPNLIYQAFFFEKKPAYKYGFFVILFPSGFNKSLLFFLSESFSRNHESCLYLFFFSRFFKRGSTGNVYENTA